jgi:arginine-tRNA-protein transferase
MDDCSPEKYIEFLVSSWADTRFIEYRESDRLLAVSVVDFVASGMSAVYTFYDPEFEARGLGTYAILRQIEECRKLGMEYLFLGYWIENHPKMAYKTRFRPHEIFVNKRWLRADS